MIRILFFAHLREETGQAQVEIEGSGKTIKQIKKEVEEQFHASWLHSAMTAVNEEFVPEDYRVKEGDVVAFIPPVSGG
ncbi:MAG: molybdopterin converting factor subunit 1 [Bacillales bacterium]|nr:molybdopterin converting factor subunit 1 [Bacillales bacterium]